MCIRDSGHTTALEGSEIHRTAKFFIGGKQARPDGGTVRPVWNKDGSLAGTVGQGNRKDLAMPWKPLKRQVPGANPVAT